MFIHVVSRVVLICSILSLIPQFVFAASIDQTKEKETRLAIEGEVTIISDETDTAGVDISTETPVKAALTKENSEPLWEAGIVLGAGRLPANRGSEEYSTYYLPLPYFVYKGDILKIDGESITGRFFNSENLDINTSIFFTLNDNDTAREGMPDLDLVAFAVGPALKYYFRRIANDGYDLSLDLPIRAAISGDYDDGLSINYRGLQSRINLSYKDKNVFNADGKYEFGAATGIVFYDEKLAEYYFGVENKYATADREAYDPGAGYAGASASLDFLYNVNEWLGIRTYGRLDFLQGTDYENSPLVTEPMTSIIGVAIMGKFWRSETRVPKR